jgi:prepilin-type N-terminal cleavage/methylation domain-containing protein
MRKQSGFSLIELLIVVAIILVIAAIAIPNLLRSRIAANEASAVGSLRTINTAQVTYCMTYPAHGYADDLSLLGGVAGTTASSAGALLLDNVLGCSGATNPGSICTKGGYQFQISGTTSLPVSTYTTTGNPVAVGQTGVRYFYSDASGVIRYNQTSIATSNDLALQ